MSHCVLIRRVIHRLRIRTMTTKALVPKIKSTCKHIFLFSLRGFQCRLCPCWCFRERFQLHPSEVGDIIESILGMQYLLRHYNVPEVPHFPHSFARFLHDGCLALYRWRAATRWIYNEVSDIARFIFPLEVEREGRQAHLNRSVF